MCVTLFYNRNFARTQSPESVQSSPQDSKDFKVISKCIKSDITPQTIFNIEDPCIIELDYTYVLKPARAKTLNHLALTKLGEGAKHSLSKLYFLTD